MATTTTAIAIIRQLPSINGIGNNNSDENSNHNISIVSISRRSNVRSSNNRNNNNGQEAAVVFSNYRPGAIPVLRPRSGTTRLLDVFELGPLLTFPSFHAVSAALYVWACWPIRWLRGVGLIGNTVMLAATPIGGGHYFVDVIAGLVVAVASIYAVNRIGRYLARPRDPLRNVSKQLSTVAT